jgi:type IV pilus assembly protein PilF
MKGAFLWLCLTACAALQLGCVSEPVTESALHSQGTASEVARVNTQLGLAYLVEGQLSLALERLQTAAQADPDYSTAQNGLGLVYDRLKMPHKAEEHFKRAIRANPSDSAAQTNYGSFLCRHGRIDEGEKYFMKAAKNTLYDKPELAYVNAGVCKRGDGDLKTAESHFRSALQIDPRFPVALLNMAELTYDAKRYMSARAYLQRYNEVGTQTSRSLWLGILVEGELGDKDAVSSYAMLLRANYPDSRETQLLLESGVQ